MTYNLFIDDERFPPADNQSWVIVRTFSEAVSYVKRHGSPSFISFDHDLGLAEDKTGYDFAKWYVDYLIENKQNTLINFYVHSQNPVGKRNIEAYIASWNSNVNRCANDF